MCRTAFNPFLLRPPAPTFSAIVATGLRLALTAV
jgi:hypothetical protein